MTLLLLPILLLQACVSPPGSTPAEKVAGALAMRDTVLEQLAEREPKARERLDAAAGYVVGRGFHVHPGIGTFATAYFVVVNNETDEASFGKEYRFAIGPGLAVKSFNFVAIFEDQEKIARVVEGDNVIGYLLEAGLRFGSFGGDASIIGPVGSEAHLWIQAGFALEAAIGFVSVGPDDELNEAAAGR